MSGEDRMLVETSNESDDYQDPWYKAPIIIAIALFLLLIIVIWPLSYYAGTIDPEPLGIPGRADVIPDSLVFSNSSSNISNLDFIELSHDGQLKLIADKIVSKACDGNKLCHAKALYYFLRDEYQYIADPVNLEYVEDPLEFLSVGGGDCESGSIALAGLLENIGLDSEIVLIPSHAIVRFKYPDAPLRYRIGDYVYLDWTCSSCEFGKLPASYSLSKMRVLSIY